MTEAVTAPEQSVAAKAEAKIAAVKNGHEWWRPFRYTALFISGTVDDALNGLSKWGARGLKVGLAVGIVVAIAVSSYGLAPLLAGPLAGFVGLGGLGGAYGLVTGGFSAVARERRAILYADDLVDRARFQKAAPPNRSDYRGHYRSHAAEHSGIISQYILERNEEAKRDSNNYWRDRESGISASTSGPAI